MVKEAWEEAGIPPRRSPRRRRPRATVHICREQPDGLQRETIFVHDLWLPDDFTPACQDGEVVEHRLVSLRDAGALIANETGPDVVTADASLVDRSIACCATARSAPDRAGYAALDALRRAAARPRVD